MKKDRLFYGILTGLCAVCLTGCLGQAEQTEAKTESEIAGAQGMIPVGAAEDEILTLTPVDQSKEMVTIHYEYGLDNDKEIEAAIEEQFPDVDIVMIHDGATDSRSLLLGNLENGTECDLIFNRTLRSLGDDAEKYFLDLSDQEFVNDFYLTSLDSCVQSDGGLYYLPGPSNVYGVIYDQTLFEENGWQVPHSYTEFVELIHTIDESGLTAVEELDGEKREVPVRAIRPSLYYSDSFQSLFYPYVYQEVFAGEENLQWLNAYQQGEESLVGHMEPLAEKISQMVDDGVVRLDDWDYMPRYRTPMLCQYHSTAMILGAQNLYINVQVENSDHQYAMMPLWTDDTEDSDYLYSIPGYYMAVNRQATEEDPVHGELLLEIMDYICNPEAQEELFGEDNAQVSNIKGVTPGVNSFNEGIQETIREGRIISDFTLIGGSATPREVETKLCDTARDMLNGQITVEEWLAGGDEIRDQKLAGGSMYDTQVYGSCQDDLTRLETALLMGQVYRDVADADIGLVYVNPTDQGANCRIFEGPVDTTVIRNMAPDRTSSQGESIACGTLAGQQILDCLNGMDTAGGSSDGWYYVASGLQVEFAPWMPAGQRLVSCTLPDGSELDPEEDYRVAYMSDKIFGISGDEIVALDPADEQIREKPWFDLFTEWLDEQGGIIHCPEQTTVLDWKQP